MRRGGIPGSAAFYIGVGQIRMKEIVYSGSESRGGGVVTVSPLIRCIRPWTGQQILSLNVGIGAKRWVFTARAQLVDLNYKPRLFDENPECSVCAISKKMIPPPPHFIVRCSKGNDRNLNSKLIWKDKILARRSAQLKDSWKLKWDFVKITNVWENWIIYFYLAV